MKINLEKCKNCQLNPTITICSFLDPNNKKTNINDDTYLSCSCCDYLKKMKISNFLPFEYSRKFENEYNLKFNGGRWMVYYAKLNKKIIDDYNIQEPDNCILSTNFSIEKYLIEIIDETSEKIENADKEDTILIESFLKNFYYEYSRCMNSKKNNILREKLLNLSKNKGHVFEYIRKMFEDYKKELNDSYNLKEKNKVVKELKNDINKLDIDNFPFNTEGGGREILKIEKVSDNE